MEWLRNNVIIRFVFDVLLQEILAVFISIFLFDKVKNYLVEKKYGGWYVIIKKDHAEKFQRKVSAKKAKEILEEPADKVVFLKGVANPYGRITCDLLEEGIEKGVFIEDMEHKKFIIDFDKQDDGVENNQDLINF